MGAPFEEGRKLFEKKNLICWANHTLPDF